MTCAKVGRRGTGRSDKNFHAKQDSRRLKTDSRKESCVHFIHARALRVFACLREYPRRDPRKTWCVHSRRFGAAANA